MTEIECDIYRSRRHEYMYIYVRKEDGLDRVPDELLARFGAGEVTMSLTLHADRKLAREDVTRVMANLADQGYHLQLPPADKDILTDR